MKNIIYLSLLSFFMGCQSRQQDTTQSAVPINVVQSRNDFNDYWYAGKGEVSSYELEQSRYGEIHRGKAAFIFVTEPFSKSKQVKLDNPNANKRDKVSVLKMNATRNFNTGIYPYATMQSVFTPVQYKDHPNTLKVATSSQEWCGHTFEQLNLKKNHYDHQLFSYFESEGDKKDKLDKAWLEDELFNRIRIQPGDLPEGTIKIIPGTIFSRFRHVPLKVETATATLGNADDPEQLVYKINYPTLGRTLSIFFKKEFPHLIESWEVAEASQPDLVTRATRIKTLMLAYWGKNGTVDLKYRRELGLD